MAIEKFSFLTRALRNRNYRLFFIGQGISFVGTWIQMIALQWLVYRLTGSPWILGLVGFCSQIPSFIVTPFAGVLVDHVNRRHILIWTQSLAMLQAVILCVLFFNGAMTVNAILLLSLFTGMINAFDLPTRQAFVIEMVDKKEDLGNAIAMNSLMVHAARLIGPTIAGILIATVGEGVCFLINAVSFIAVLTSLAAMTTRPRPTHPDGARILARLKEGFAYMQRHPPIYSLIILLAAVSLMGMPYMVLLPVFARDIFHGGAHTLGFMVGTAGLGSLMGSFYLASRQGLEGFGRLIISASILFGAGLMAFAFSSTLAVSLLAMFLTGFGMMVQFAASNTVLQMMVDDDKRGRVMSFYTMAFMGMTPLGNLMAGALAHHIGASWTVFVGGGFCVLISLWFVRRLPMFRETAREHMEGKIVPVIIPGVSN